MQVKDLMTEKVLTLTPEDKVNSVLILFHFGGFRHVPVLDKGKLVGIISDRDLKKIIGSKNKFIEKPEGMTLTIAARKVKHIMRRGVVSISPDQKASKAAAIMAKKKIGALPVVHKGKLVGIITETDILKAFVELSNKLEKIDLTSFIDLIEELTIHPITKKK